MNNTLHILPVHTKVHIIAVLLIYLVAGTCGYKASYNHHQEAVEAELEVIHSYAVDLEAHIPKIQAKVDLLAGTIISTREDIQNNAQLFIDMVNTWSRGQ